jgi:hypothetical protein
MNLPKAPKSFRSRRHDPSSNALPYALMRSVRDWSSNELSKGKRKAALGSDHQELVVTLAALLSDSGPGRRSKLGALRCAKPRSCPRGGRGQGSAPPRFGGTAWLGLAM